MHLNWIIIATELGYRAPERRNKEQRRKNKREKTNCPKNRPANQKRLLKNRAKKIIGWNILLTVRGNRFGGKKKKKGRKDLMGKHGNPGSIDWVGVYRDSRKSRYSIPAAQPSRSFKRRTTDFGWVNLCPSTVIAEQTWRVPSCNHSVCAACLRFSAGRAVKWRWAVGRTRELNYVQHGVFTRKHVSARLVHSRWSLVAARSITHNGLLYAFAPSFFSLSLLFRAMGLKCDARFLFLANSVCLTTAALLLMGEKRAQLNEKMSCQVTARFSPNATIWKDGANRELVVPYIARGRIGGAVPMAKIIVDV